MSKKEDTPPIHQGLLWQLTNYPKPGAKKPLKNKWEPRHGSVTATDLVIRDSKRRKVLETIPCASIIKTPYLITDAPEYDEICGMDKIPPLSAFVVRHTEAETSPKWYFACAKKTERDEFVTELQNTIRKATGQAGNQIAKMMPEFFNHATPPEPNQDHLEEVEFSDIEEKDPQVIVDQTKQAKLDELDFSRLDLSDWPSLSVPIAKALPKVVIVDLSLNLFTTIPAEVYTLKNVVELSVAGCRLATLPAEISQLKKLIELNLEGNKITEIPPVIGKLDKLERLRMHNNCIVTVNTGIGYLNNLEELNLSGNKLSNLPHSFGDLKSLTSLDLSFNSFSQFPNEVLNLKSLLSFNISQNTLLTLSPDIGKMGRLTTFNVANNKLTTIPVSFCTIKSLQNATSSIDLSGNPLNAQLFEAQKVSNKVLMKFIKDESKASKGAPTKLARPNSAAPAKAAKIAEVPSDEPKALVAKTSPEYKRSMRQSKRTIRNINNIAFETSPRGPGQTQQPPPNTHIRGVAITKPATPSKSGAGPGPAVLPGHSVVPGGNTPITGATTTPAATNSPRGLSAEQQKQYTEKSRVLSEWVKTAVDQIGKRIRIIEQKIKVATTTQDLLFHGDRLRQIKPELEKLKPFILQLSQLSPSTKADATERAKDTIIAGFLCAYQDLCVLLNWLKKSPTLEHLVVVAGVVNKIKELAEYNV